MRCVEVRNLGHLDRPKKKKTIISALLAPKGCSYRDPRGFRCECSNFFEKRNLEKPGMATKERKTVRGPVPKLSSFCSKRTLANCFCPDGWYQLTDNYNAPTTYFADCVKLSSDEKTWFDAAESCPSLTRGRAFLSSQLSQDRHITDGVYLQQGLGYTGSFHIGLSYNATLANYIWEEKYPNCSHIPVCCSAATLFTASAIKLASSIELG